jgi:hypothetical protein
MHDEDALCFHIMKTNEELHPDQLEDDSIREGQGPLQRSALLPGLLYIFPCIGKQPDNCCTSTKASRLREGEKVVSQGTRGSGTTWC